MVTWYLNPIDLSVAGGVGYGLASRAILRTALSKGLLLLVSVIYAFFSDPLENRTSFNVRVLLFFSWLMMGYSLS